MANTTHEQATKTLAHVEKVYGRFGFTTDGMIAEKLVQTLTGEDDNNGQEPAEAFRRWLEALRPGGSTSANTTRKVFAELGRLDETNDNWV